jgi:hypothetical protein
MASHARGKLIERNTGQAQFPPLSASPTTIKNRTKTEMRFNANGGKQNEENVETWRVVIIKV